MNVLARYWFYARYAFRSFRRSGARAVFAVFCVAAGVAAVVALQLVSANLKAAITGNAQQQTRGDVAITAPPRGMPLADYRSIQSLAHRHAFLAYTPLV
jgi:predicted lysophospholipase L1 biosynthesis ABC-type transport system permease subunit